MPLHLVPLALAGAGVALAKSLSSRGDQPEEPTVSNGNLDRLILDRFSGDGPCPWLNLAQDESFDGAILKASEGVGYAPSWFVEQWEAAHTAGVRFLGSYHFLRFDQTGASQAQTYLAQLRKVGFGSGNHFNPVVDFEQGGPTHANRSVGKSQALTALNSFMATVEQATGRPVILYGGSALRDWGITKADIPRFWKLWTARYSATLPATTYTSMGMSVSDLFAWQYCGDSESYLPGYPKTVDGFGKCDISAMQMSLTEACQ